jgi:DNA-binding CsgD family transcriptional regulator
LSSLAEQVTHEMRTRGLAAAEAEALYRREYAQAYLAADGKTVDERKAQADLAVHEVFRDRRRAEAILDAAKEAGRNYRAQLDALRSVNSNLRALVVGS